MTISRTFLNLKLLIYGQVIPDSLLHCTGLPDKLADTIKPFSEEEIKKAVWGLWADKAQGPDSFPIFFYQHFWDIVKIEVVNSWKAYKGTLLLDMLNYTHVVFIPKITESR